MKLLCTIILILTVCDVHTQENLTPIPGLKDWFLTTGVWNQDAELYICEFGNGKDTVIVLHGGWGGDHSGMIDAVKALSNDFHFVLYDQRGSLRSPFPDSLITFDNHINDIELLRQELNLNKIILVGHSMGAVLASAYASKYPDRVRNLILLAPANLKNPIPDEDIKILEIQRDKQQAFINRPEINGLLTKFKLIREMPPLSSKENTALFRINFAKRMLYDINKWSELKGGRSLYKGNVFSLTEASYPGNGWNYIEDFKDVSYPISILSGDHDFLDFGNKLATNWVIETPHIHLDIVKNAGHLIWIDQPEVFTKLLRNHLSN